MVPTVPSPRHPSVSCVGVSREGGPHETLACTKHSDGVQAGVGVGLGRPYQGPAARSAARMARSSGSAIGDGVGGGQLGGGLVAAAEAGQGPGPGLVGVGEVEVAERRRPASAPSPGRRGAGRASPWPSTAWACDTSHAARAAFSGPRAGRPAPVVRRGVRPPSRSSTSSAVRSVRRRAAPTWRCWRRRRGAGAARPRHRPGRRRRRRCRRSAGSPSSGAPVSSSDFIESRIHGQPSPTLADVPGLSARSRWIVVTLVTPSAPGVMIHSTVLGGSSASAASYSTRHVITRRRPGSTSVTSPATASVPSGQHVADRRAGA